MQRNNKRRQATWQNYKLKLLAYSLTLGHTIRRVPLVEASPQAVGYHIGVVPEDVGTPEEGVVAWYDLTTDRGLSPLPELYLVLGRRGR